MTYSHGMRPPRADAQPEPDERRRSTRRRRGRRHPRDLARARAMPGRVHGASTSRPTPAPTGASVRNFGLIWVSGRRSGEELEWPPRPPPWEEIGADACRASASGPRARSPSPSTGGEREVMEAFAEHLDAAGAPASPSWNPTRCGPATRPCGATSRRAALHRRRGGRAAPGPGGTARATWLAARGTATLPPRTPVVAVEKHGADRRHGHPMGGGPRRHRHRRRLRPTARHRSPSRPVCAGSACRCSRPRPPATAHDVAWPTPTRCGTTRPTKSRPLAELGEAELRSPPAHHLQLLLVQRPDGGLTIGDTHAYGEPFDFALCEDPAASCWPGPRRSSARALPPVRAALGRGLRPVHRRRRLPTAGGQPGRLARDRARRAWHDVCPAIAADTLQRRRGSA